MSASDVELDVTVNTAAATAEIARLADDAEAAAGANGKAAASTRDWRKEANGLKENLEKQAGAIGALTIAFGQQEGTVGKLARGVGGLALAFSSGGPFGVALAATVAIIGELDEAYASIIAKQDAMLGAGADIAQSAFADLAKIRGELKALQDEGGDPLTAKMRAVDLQRRETQAEIERTREAMSRLAATTGLTDEAFVAASIRSDGYKARLLALTKQVEELDKVEGTLAGRRASSLADEKDARDAARAAANSAAAGQRRRDQKDEVNRDNLFFGAGVPLEQDVRPALDELDALIADHDKAVARIDADKRAVEKAQWDEHYNAIADARFEAHRRAVFQIENLEKDLFENQMPAFASSGINAFQGYLDAKIKGEEDAEALAAAAFLRSTGQQLVGVGTKALFEGAAISANPYTPGAGIPLMAIGAAAIAAGVGMGAGATGIEHVAAGGTIGQALPDAAAKKDRGLNARTSSPSGRSGGSGGAGMTVVNNYGVSGPTAEDQAREMARRQALIFRRRFTG